MIIRKPNLFIVGAMKSGTSSLHAYLGAHPEVFMCTPKEPSYFTQPGGLAKADTAAGNEPSREPIDRYLALFAAAGTARIIGESSTDYSKLPKYEGVARRIHSFNPEARIVYVMREPIARTLSHYWHAVRVDGETRSLNAALRGDAHYVNVSDYAMQIRPYLEHFGRRRLFAMTFEEMQVAPEDVLRQLFRWLGVDDTFIPPNLSRIYNETPSELTQRRLWGVPERFRRSRFWGRVGPLTPAAFRTVGQRLTGKVVDKRTVDDTEARHYLASILAPKTEDLRRLLDRRFPEWT